MKLFFWKINLKSKYIKIPKGVPYPSTNPASQGFNSFTEQTGQGNYENDMYWNQN